MLPIVLSISQIAVCVFYYFGLAIEINIICNVVRFSIRVLTFRLLGEMIVALFVPFVLYTWAWRLLCSKFGRDNLVE